MIANVLLNAHHACDHDDDHDDDDHDGDDHDGGDHYDDGDHDHDGGVRGLQSKTNHLNLKSKTFFSNNTKLHSILKLILFSNFGCVLYKLTSVTSYNITSLLYSIKEN